MGIRMNPAVRMHGLKEKSVWIQESIVFLACFLYLFLKVHPTLILESQPPVFLLDNVFFKEFLNIPGGMIDWFSALFLQFWFSDLISALLMTLSFWIVSYCTRLWMVTLTDNSPVHTFQLIPVGMLIFLQGHYDFQFRIVLALIVNLVFLIVFIRWAPKRPVVRTVASLVLSIFLYWSTGGAFLIFALLVGLNEILVRGKIIGGFLSVAIALILPAIGFSTVFLVTKYFSYLHNLLPDDRSIQWNAGIALPAFYALAALCFAGVKFIGQRKLWKKIADLFGFARLAFGWKVAAGTLLLAGGFLLLAWDSVDTTARLVLQMNKCVREGRWTEVLDSARKSPVVNPIISCQTNLALFNTGKLLDTMFTYPQTEGTGGLLMNSTWCLAWPEEASNVCWKLGLVNASLHWAHEAFEYKGSTHQILRQLGKVYMVKGEHRAAGMFFKNLKRVPFQTDDSETLIQLNENPGAVASNAEFKDIQESMPAKDLISLGRSSFRELELLLNRNPRNKMAFEYLIAYSLLNGNLKEIFTMVPGFRAFHYDHIPVHVQEALILGAALTPKFDQNMLKGLVGAAVYKHFMEYRQSTLRYRGNKNEAKLGLQKEFGDTYWYYALFTRSAIRQSESQNDFQ
jgi:hypothetical protein